MNDVTKIIQQDYNARLRKDGIPLDPSRRTDDQQQTATLEAWAAINEVLVPLQAMTQADLEANHA